MFRFADWYFLLFIPLIIYLFFRKKKKDTLKFSSIKILKHGALKKTYKHIIGRALVVLAIILLITALARPQTSEEVGPIKQPGIDISVVLDVSGTMRSVDFEPNRLEVAKKTIEDFVTQRPGDRISLIIFAGTAYTKVPLTLDHNIVRELLQDVSVDSVNKDGTAIGMGISVGLNRLKKSDSSSKVMILVTDGDNNAGSINPDTASNLAKEMGVRIYTVGVGTDRTIIPVQVMGQTDYQRVRGGLNEELLKKISDITDGQYYRAEDSEALSQIFANINELEKTEFEQENFRQYNELAFLLMKIALIILLIGVFLDKYYYIQIPQ
ncbi:MAG: vWA domain-containing protein [Bacillota bacterium]